MTEGVLWTVQDQYGNEIYLTEERWDHIIDPINHPDMIDYMDELKDTIQYGKRRQNPLNPQKYQYVQAFYDLELDNTHIVAIVLCRYRDNVDGQSIPNNYIVTAYQKEID